MHACTCPTAHADGTHLIALPYARVPPALNGSLAATCLACPTYSLSPSQSQPLRVQPPPTIEVLRERSNTKPLVKASSDTHHRQNLPANGKGGGLGSSRVPSMTAQPGRYIPEGYTRQYKGPARGAAEAYSEEESVPVSRCSVTSCSVV